MIEHYIKFWGVRGSRPVSRKNILKYGGNTPCVEIRMGKKLIIFDAGTGVCELGDELIEKNEYIEADIFVTHYHWDHIQGFPFFAPVLDANNKFRIYGEKKGELGVEEVLSKQMQVPFFPIGLDKYSADLKFINIEDNQEIDLGGGIIVKTISTNHPNGNISYKIECEGRSCCYITDIEHSEDIDNNLIKFIENTDLLIYDSYYSDEEYAGGNEISSKKGWGHSTWQEGIKYAKRAKVKGLAIFHHNISRTDEELDIIEKEAKKLFPKSFVAREGMVVKL